MDDKTAQNILEIQWKHNIFTRLSTQQNNSIFIAFMEHAFLTNQR